MKIERVDDKTVKCFLSNEELEEYDIDYKDFIARTEKAREVMQEIIETATEEVGYKPPKFAFDMQIMMMPEQGMVLTLSEKDPIDLNNREQMMSYLKGLKDLFQMAQERFEEAGTALKAIEAAPKQPESATGQVQKSAGQHPEGKRAEFAIFRFATMRDLMDYAAVIPTGLRVKSTLYVSEGVYYLTLSKGSASYERYSRACVQALEFSSLYSADEGRILFLQEHGECLIAEGALKKLRF